MCFQSSKPLIHKVYYRQIELLKQFLSYFMKPSVLSNCTTGKKLLKLKISESNLLNESMLFVGQKAKHIIQSAKAGDTTVQEFLTAAAKAYKTCGEYTQNKLPLQNKTLKSLATIDPEFILSKMEVLLNYLLGLPDLLVHVLDGDEKHEEYEKEVRKLMFDNTLPACTDENGDEVDIVHWWSAISTKYPLTYKIVMAVLSIFCTPRVESSFNIMGDTIDKKSNRMKVNTFNASQDIKYALQALHPAQCTSRAIKVFHRADKHYSPIDSSLVTNMRLARSRQKSEQAVEREEMRKRESSFQMSVHGKTKKAVAAASAKIAEVSRMKHQEILEKAYKPNCPEPNNNSAACRKRKSNAPTGESSRTNAKKSK